MILFYVVSIATFATNSLYLILILKDNGWYNTISIAIVTVLKED
mgnify:CR=1 FL=1